jgi:hypothetical protein
MMGRFRFGRIMCHSLNAHTVKEKENMRVKLGENSITLEPESQWEQDALKRLKKRGIRKMEFHDAWNQEGGLRLEHGDKE